MIEPEPMPVVTTPHSSGNSGPATDALASLPSDVVPATLLSLGEVGTYSDDLKAVKDESSAIGDVEAACAYA